MVYVQLFVGNHQQELVAAVTGKQPIVFFAHVPENCRHVLQDAVGHLVPEAFIQLLKAVDVHNDYGEGLVQREHFVQALCRRAPVQDVQVLVVLCLVAQLLVGLLQLLMRFPQFLFRQAAGQGYGVGHGDKEQQGYD